MKKTDKEEQKNTKKTEFSKALLIQESALIWIISISFLILAFVCVKNEYFGELPWLTAMVGLPWGAYAVSQAFYYRKAMKENIKDGIKYESVMADINSEIKTEEATFFQNLNETSKEESDSYFKTIDLD